MPLIAWWPGTVKAGMVSWHVSAFWDFLPTAAEIGGAEAPPGIDGISFLPVLLGTPESQKEHEFLYWEFHERGSKQAVRHGDWKAVRDIGGQMELFNLKDDPGEKNNVAGAHPDVVAKIEEYLKTARTESPGFPLKTSAVRRMPRNGVPADKFRRSFTAKNRVESLFSNPKISDDPVCRSLILQALGMDRDLVVTNCR